MPASRERSTTQDYDESVDHENSGGAFLTPSRVRDSALQNTDTAHLEQRYGRKRRRRFDRVFAWIIIALLGAGVVWFFTAGGFNFADNDIDARDLGHKIINEREASLTFELNVQPDTPTACAIEAVTKSHAPVGYKIIEIPASDDRTRTFTAELITVGEATTITVRECWSTEES
ncbi:MAG: DUF4307 domain-containing protein [Canibacter sp.]